tara:strand:- start:890 stop:1474 length:585 start_codon:yes stop_codon:yes gene_type:complete
MLAKEMFFNKKNIFFLLIFFFIIKPIEASIKKKIILNLKNTKNITFNFEQKINNILEQGKCTIEYPKKIYCLYNNNKKKILVSNGKTLVITNQKKSSYYLYPLNKTPLELILDKDFLIKEMKSIEGRNVDNRYYNFTILNNNNKINIFFNNKNYNLIGWQTEDIYQNLAITFISEVKTNQIIDKKIFKIPKKIY